MADFAKIGGKLYAHLNAKERQAIDRAVEEEAYQQLAEFDRKNACEIDAMMLYQLHKQLGFGYKRLRRFYENFIVEYDALVKRYEADRTDGVWLSARKLLDETGVDIEEWDRERSKEL